MKWYSIEDLYTINEYKIQHSKTELKLEKVAL